MISIVMAVVLAGCSPQVTPEAADVRATHGKPDRYEVAKCGGGKDEYGEPIPKWECLIWWYEGKGRLLFETNAASKKGWWMVFGCGTERPRVEKQERAYWVLSHCLDKNGKEAGCADINLAADRPAHFKRLPVRGEDQDEDSYKAAWVEWMQEQTQICFTEAEARALAKTCAVKAPRETKPAVTEPPAERAEKSI